MESKFNGDESGYYDNKDNFYINGSLKYKDDMEVGPILQHEHGHWFIFMTSSLGLLIRMCSKISITDNSKDLILEGLSKYYRRMNEEVATYTEMITYLMMNGREQFLRKVDYLKYNNKSYYKYYKKLSCRNILLSQSMILTYDKEKLKKLIDCLLLLGRDSFNIDILAFEIEKLDSLGEIQTLMSEDRFNFNPNRRFSELIKTLIYIESVFIYNKNQVQTKNVDSMEIVEYINIVKKMYPNNLFVESKLISFKFNSLDNDWGIPNLDYSFPFLDIKGEKYEYSVPEFKNNPNELLDLTNINSIEFKAKGSFIFASVFLSDNKNYLYTYVDDELNGGFLLILQAIYKNKALLKFDDFYIFKYQNWSILLDSIPQMSYIISSKPLSSTMEDIIEHFHESEFMIHEMEGFDMLVVKRNKLYLLQPIVSQLSKALVSRLKGLNFKLVKSFEDEEQIRNEGNKLINGITLERKINKEDIIKDLKKKLNVL